MKDHCKHGHPLSGDNLRTWNRPTGGVMRICRRCHCDRRKAENAALRWPEPHGRVSRPAPGCRAVWCKRGHRIDGDGAWHIAGRRRCKTCHRHRNRRWMQAYRDKRREAVA